MARRLIGTDTTGTDGSVTIPYTGTGAGVVQMDVETEIDGSIVSVPCNVIDSILAFDGSSVTSNFNDVYNVLKSVDNGYIKIEQQNTSNKWQTFTVGGQSTGWLDPTKDYRCEFDFQLGTNTYNVFGICGGNVALSRVNDTDEHSAKVELIDGVVNLYFDGNTSSYHQVNVGSDTTCSFGLNNLDYIKVKNFKLYPI